MYENSNYCKGMKIIFFFVHTIFIYQSACILYIDDLKRFALYIINFFHGKIRRHTLFSRLEFAKDGKKILYENLI